MAWCCSFRRKQSGRTEYLQIAKNERIAGKPASIRRGHPWPGRRTGAGRHSRTAVALRRALFTQCSCVLAAYEKGEATKLATRQRGPALAMERVWRETGCQRVISEVAGERGFQFDLERAVPTVLHRLFDPGSDRAAEKWRHGLVIDGVADLELHQLYRTMGWLGDELADQSGPGSSLLSWIVKLWRAIPWFLSSV